MARPGFSQVSSAPHPSIVRAIRFLTLGALAALVVVTVASAQPLTTGASHRGVVPAGPYEIFPENRPGNAVYLDGEVLLSLPGQAILSVAQIAPGGRFIYLARGNDGKRVVGFNTKPGDSAPRITEPVKGFQYVVAGFDGQGFKKLFRVTDTAVTDMLSASRTADGLTVGPSGVVFFHVGASSTQGDSVPAGSYGIRLHLLNPAAGTVKHLGRTILNTSPTIKLAWLDDGQIQYTLNDGTTTTVSVSDFK